MKYGIPDHKNQEQNKQIDELFIQAIDKISEVVEILTQIQQKRNEI